MIDAKTILVGLIGSPVRHSLSPAMHTSAFAELGLNYAYLAFEVGAEAVEGALQGVKALGLRGLNVTMPHKLAVVPHLDELDSLAEKIGAVNTVVNEKGKLRGYNTDASGALEALESKAKVKGKSVLLLGAGGAARAIAHALAEKGASITIANIDLEQGKELADKLQCSAVKLSDVGGVDAEILINATPVGMHPKVGEMPVGQSVLKDKTVFDIVYHPVSTKLLQEAEKLGCTTVNGLEMLINQGAHSFELWTNAKAPRDVMRSAVLKSLGEKQ